MKYRDIKNGCHFIITINNVEYLLLKDIKGKARKAFSGERISFKINADDEVKPYFFHTGPCRRNPKQKRKEIRHAVMG